MARRNLSDLLQNRFACSVPWDTMSGEGATRFCDQCRCEVFDLAQMEPKTIKARLEAQHGRMCARTIRENGQLKTLTAAAPEPRQRQSLERAPTLAAGVFSGWLALASPLAAATPPPEAALVANVGAEEEGAIAADSEQVVPEGYSEEIDVSATLESYGGRATVGIVVGVELNLREYFDESELVLIAKVGGSQILAIEEGLAEVHTTLRIARRFKGEGWQRQLTFRHTLLADSVGPAEDLLPGNLVLVFLSRAENDLDLLGQPLYEATNFYSAQRLAPGEVDAYAFMLDKLAQLRRMAGKDGELDPAGLMEWLVATMENPFTRAERVGGEIGSALEAFERVVAAEGHTDAAFLELGANFTEDHRLRLSAALLATQTLRNADLDLYRLVKELDPETATLWRIESLYRAATPENLDVHWWLTEIAEAIGLDPEHPFLASAAERLEAVDELYPFEGPSADLEAWEQKSTHLSQVLLGELANLYAASRE